MIIIQYTIMVLSALAMVAIFGGLVWLLLNEDRRNREFISAFNAWQQDDIRCEHMMYQRGRWR